MNGAATSVVPRSRTGQVRRSSAADRRVGSLDRDRVRSCRERRLLRSGAGRRRVRPVDRLAAEPDSAWPCLPVGRRRGSGDARPVPCRGRRRRSASRTRRRSRSALAPGSPPRLPSHASRVHPDLQFEVLGPVGVVRVGHPNVVRSRGGKEVVTQRRNDPLGAVRPDLTGDEIVSMSRTTTVSVMRGVVRRSV